MQFLAVFRDMNDDTWVVGPFNTPKDAQDYIKVNRTEDIVRAEVVRYLSPVEYIELNNELP